MGSQLQANTAEISAGAVLQSFVILGTEQPRVGVSQLSEHRLNGPIGIVTALDAAFHGLLALTSPTDLIKLLWVPKPLVDQTPAVHHELLCIAECNDRARAAQDQKAAQNGCDQLA